MNISARDMGVRLVNRTGLFYNLTLGRDYVLQYFEEYGKGVASTIQVTAQASR